MIVNRDEGQVTRDEEMEKRFRRDKDFSAGLVVCGLQTAV